MFFTNIIANIFQNILVHLPTTRATRLSKTHNVINELINIHKYIWFLPAVIDGGDLVRYSCIECFIGIGNMPSGLSWHIDISSARYSQSLRIFLL